MHYCAYHKIEEKESSFRIKKNGKLDSWCIEGRKEHGREYSKNAYAARKAEVAKEKAEKEAATTKICTECKIEKSIDEFALRPDRPNKRHAKCNLCFGGIRKIRSSTPEARKYDARYKSLKRAIVAKSLIGDPEENNEYIDILYGDPCCFCGSKEKIEIDHINPLAPGSEKHGDHHWSNFTSACAKCNNSKNDKSLLFYMLSRPDDLSDDLHPFHGWFVKEISSQTAREIAISKHYLHRKQNVSYGYGLYSPKGELQGIVSFGSPGSFRINKSACPLDPTCVIELNRLWIDDNTPSQIASWFVSRALNILPAYIVVSYADTGAKNDKTGEAHSGGIYRALSFNYSGLSKKAKEWRLPGKAKNVGRKTSGSQCHIVTPKRRFWTVTGNKSQKKLLKSKCNWLILPYE